MEANIIIMHILLTKIVKVIDMIAKNGLSFVLPDSE